MKKNSANSEQEQFSITKIIFNKQKQFFRGLVRLNTLFSICKILIKLNEIFFKLVLL